MAMNISRAKDISPGMMVTAAICGGSALKIKGFEFNPSLSLNLTHPEGTMYTREIVVSGSNAYLDTPVNVTVSILMQEQERSLDARLYIAYAILPLLMFALLRLLKKWSKNDEDDHFAERNQKDVRPSDSSNMYTEASSSVYSKRPNNKDSIISPMNSSDARKIRLVTE